MLSDRCLSVSVMLVCCGQTAEWIKMPLGMEIGLGPGDIVLDGDPAPQRKRAQQPPLFGPCHVAKRSPISATAEFLLQKVIKNFGTEDIPIGLFHTSFKWFKDLINDKDTRPEGH